MAKITISQLETLNACPEQRQVFEELFGDSIEITPDLAEKYFDKFNSDWAAENLLKPEYYIEYEKIENSAYVEYRNIKNPAYVEYRKIMYSAYAYAEYQKIRDSAFDEYNKISIAAYAEYRKIVAKAFVELYIQQETKD
jgi:hypothetical protein